MKLVIVESPAKCGKIQGFLGDGYQVLASMGHIRALEESLDAVGLDKGWEPTYRFLEKEKGRTLSALKEAARGAEQVFLAADDDREGEAIAYSVAMLLKLPLRSTPRIVFHEITEKAIRAAMATPRLLDMNRIHSQQARAMLDMMIGFTLSPLSWGHVARGLSAGRCQTPALRLVVEREQEIEAFKGVSSWKLAADWQTPKQQGAGGGLVPMGPGCPPFRFNAFMIDALADEESALAYLENHSTDRRATVRSNTVKPWSASPPAPLITSTLQQQASALFSLAPKTTMQIAQKLYEAGHITYMRTDKAVLSEEAIGAAHEWIRATYGEAYVGEVLTPPIPSSETEAKETATASKSKKGKKSGKKEKEDEKEKEAGPKAQEAHEAIRPTHMEQISPAGLEPLHAKLYGLIRQRAVQSCMAAAQGETCTVVFDAEDDNKEYPWRSAWKRTTFPGWQRLGRVAELEEDEKGLEEAASSESDATASWEKAITLKPGAELVWQTLTANPHETKPPPRFTEATLVRELERFGIGRPSTFSSLIAAIQERGYAEVKDIPGKEVAITTYTLKADSTAPVATTHKKKMGQEKQKLVPTELGRHAITFLLKHFPELFDFRFTATMEARLDAIASAGEPWKQVLEDTWASYKDTYEDLKKKGTAAGAAGTNPKIRILDPATGLKAVLSKKGPLLLREFAAAGGGAGAGAAATAAAATATAAPTTTFYGWPPGIPFESITLEQATAFLATAAKSKEGEILGDWKGQPVLKRVGKFGPYVTWGDIRLTLKPGDVEDVAAMGGRLDALAAAKTTTPTGILRTFKEYEIKIGPYGPYIYKPALKKRQFVSVPKGTVIESITEKEVAELYKKGLEAKKKWSGKKN
jgi:DNA topoisomerase I